MAKNKKEHTGFQNMPSQKKGMPFDKKSGTNKGGMAGRMKTPGNVSQRTFNRKTP